MSEDIEKIYEKLGIPLGNGERVFWSSEYKTEKEIPDIYKGEFCTAFPDINKKNIVKDSDSKADLVVPNNLFIRKHGITSFLKFDPDNEEQKKLLIDMIKTILKNSNPNDSILFFNVLKEKVSRDDKDHCMIMTISYLHLWVVEKSKMFNTDKVFHKDSQVNKNYELFTEKEIECIKNYIPKIIKGLDDCSIIENTNSECFAPIHIKIVGKGKTDLEKIVDSLIKTSRIIKEIEKNFEVKKFIDRGFRIMVRKNGEWSSNILGGGRLSTISKMSD